MRSAGRQPSLRRRLLLGLLVPTGVVAVVLGAGGSLLIHEVVQATSDRLLDGSVLAIAERIAVEDGELTVDLPRVALGMLETRTHDSVYYNVTYQGAVVTGYGDLPLPDVAAMVPGETAHRDALYRGVPVRIAAGARRVYGRPDPVLVQVAQTVNARRALERGMLLGLAGLEAALLGLVALAA